MPRDIKQTVYQYSELSEKAKENARSWFTESCMDDWSEFSLEAYVAMLQAVGFRDPKIQYRGFWSQGDGACFTGRWIAEYCNPELITEYKDEKYSEIAARFIELAKEFQRANFDVIHAGGMYSHENSVRFEFELDSDNVDFFHKKAAEALKHASKDLMRLIYDGLEKEYNYQTSDDAIAESMEANEYEFFSNGARFRG